MEAFFERISNYQFLNNLLPGAIYIVALNIFTTFSITNDNILISLFIYYFTGIVISRFGSIVIEPLLKITKFINYQPYRQYISAASQDKKINLLLEHNNLFRSLLAMLCLIGMTILYEKLQLLCPFFEKHGKILILLLLVALFLFSFRKQTEFIYDRIEHYNPKEDKK